MPKDKLELINRILGTLHWKGPIMLWPYEDYEGNQKNAWIDAEDLISIIKYAKEIPK